MGRDAQAYEGTYQGEKAIWLKAGCYEAAVLPEIGGNLIAFRDMEKKYRFLHEPTMDEMDSFKANPIVHGIPVLFPPNRYEDGKFHWNSTTYKFPVNEPQTGNHLHGFVHNIPWQIERFSADDAESHVTLALKVNKDHQVYRYLPHFFTIKIRYTLGEQGLFQQVTVRNDGEDQMPCLLAFHTAINAPFAQDSTAADYRFKLTIGKRWELSERMLPTGQYQPLTLEEERMREGGLSPFFEPMDNHYTAAPQNGRNRMELTDVKQGITLVYDAGTAYKQWMIWNNNATEGFFCPEPQINLVNAPNLNSPLDPELIGLHSLDPGDIWEETSRIYIKAQSKS